MRPGGRPPPEGTARPPSALTQSPQSAPASPCTPRGGGGSDRGGLLGTSSSHRHTVGCNTRAAGAHRSRQPVARTPGDRGAAPTPHPTPHTPPKPRGVFPLCDRGIPHAVLDRARLHALPRRLRGAHAEAVLGVGGRGDRQLACGAGRCVERGGRGGWAGRVLGSARGLGKRRGRHACAGQGSGVLPSSEACPQAAGRRCSSRGGRPTARARRERPARGLRAAARTAVAHAHGRHLPLVARGQYRQEGRVLPAVLVHLLRQVVVADVVGAPGVCASEGGGGGGGGGGGSEAREAQGHGGKGRDAASGRGACAAGGPGAPTPPKRTRPAAMPWRRRPPRTALPKRCTPPGLPGKTSCPPAHPPECTQAPTAEVKPK